MQVRLAALGACLAAVAIPLAAHADGVLPPQPYRYLHPPPALTSENSPPESGTTSLRVIRGHAPAGHLFTQDTQAGLVLPAGAVVAAPGATSIRIHIDPVETPAGLPQHYAAEGNAYRVTVSAEPGHTAVRLARAINLILRWPHPPLAIYQYASGKWSQVCYSDNATFTTSTMACPITGPGIFTAVTNPALSGTVTPRPVSSNRFSWLGKYIPLIVVLVVAVLVALVALLTRRPGGKSNDGR